MGDALGFGYDCWFFSGLERVLLEPDGEGMGVLRCAWRVGRLPATTRVFGTDLRQEGGTVVVLIEWSHNAVGTQDLHCVATLVNSAKVDSPH